MISPVCDRVALHLVYWAGRYGRAGQGVQGQESRYTHGADQGEQQVLRGAASRAALTVATWGQHDTSFLFEGTGRAEGREKLTSRDFSTGLASPHGVGR